MAAKRLINHEEDDHDDELQQKRMRSTPSFATVVSMVIYRNTLSNVMEPLIRKVVNEEVEKSLQRIIKTLSRSPSMRIQAIEPSILKLVFTNKSLPTKTFTFTKIHDIYSQPLKIVLVEQRGDEITPFIPHNPIKVEIVVVDGDFPATDGGLWTAGEFNHSIVKKRENKPPLLAKDINYTMRDGCNSLTLGSIELTDNSSWIRCRKFKLGARVVAETSHGDRILEALTDAFMVKDHRGELYKKNYPPNLGDEVWRLEKIGKDGAFHKRLTQEGICNVQDFLKMSVLNPTKLQKILGGNNGLTNKKWEAILKHARTCNLGNKLYISNGPNYSIFLDPICQISSINIHGQNYPYPTSHMDISFKKSIDELVENAYKNWDSLEEVDKPLNMTFQLPQGNLVGEYGNDSNWWNC